MKPPMTYSEWLVCLDRVRSDVHDEELLISMEAGSIEWSSGVAERFVTEFYRMIEFRLRRSAELFQRDLKSAQRSHDDLVRAMMAVRRHISVSLRLCQLKAIPEVVRHEIDGRIRDHARKCQESLEDSARQDKSGKLLSIVRNNSITGREILSLCGSAAEAKNSEARRDPQQGPPGAIRRRVLL